MKSLFLITILVFAFATTSWSQNSPAEELAGKIAQKMKDTLTLNEDQRGQVYTINLQLHQQKAAVWQQYGDGDSTVLQEKLQAVENTRDSLYMGVLREAQFQLYKQKKPTLISSQ